MTRILTGVSVSNTVGWIFQSIFILWNIVDIALLIRHWGQYRKIPDKTSVDKLYFYFIVLAILSESIRAIDPFSMHDIYPFYANRLFQISFGALFATNFGIISGDTYHSILYKINHEIRPWYFRSFALTSMVIVTLPTLCTIGIISFTAITMDTTNNNKSNIDLSNTALKMTFGCSIFGLSMILVSFLTDINKMNVNNHTIDVTKDDPRQAEIISHAKQRVIKGLRSQMANIIFSIIAIALEFIDGGYAINGYYFLSGLIYGIALRIVPTILLFVQWIPEDNDDNDDDDDDDDTEPLAMRRTTVGYLREIAQGIDLTRMKTTAGHLVTNSNSRGDTL